MTTSFIAGVYRVADVVLRAEFDYDSNDQVVTKSPFLPPLKEFVIGTIATLIVVVALYKLAWPTIRDGMKARTARIQAELDQSAAAKADAEREASKIRSALGDIDAERDRLFAEADAQSEALLADGRAQLEVEVANLESKAVSDIAVAEGRGADDLRVEVARYSAAAIEDSVRMSLDDATQQELIENFIARVGAGR